jgi:hypothetical protein
MENIANQTDITVKTTKQPTIIQVCSPTPAEKLAIAAKPVNTARIQARTRQKSRRAYTIFGRGAAIWAAWKLAVA